MTEALDQILLFPGLYWISELIFVEEFLDSDDVLANLWKRRLFYKIAKAGSYRRSLLVKYPEWTNTDSLKTLEEQNILFRSLAFKFSKKSKLSSWKNNK